MKNPSLKRKFSGTFIAFLVVALAFLAVGLGTLGSFTSAGAAYELTVKREGDNQTPNVVFHVTNPKGEDGKSLDLTVDEVYLNVAIIYAEDGVPATVQLKRRTSSSSSFSGTVTATLENFYTPEAIVDEEGKVVREAVKTTAQDVFFRYTMPFVSASDPTDSLFPDAGWRVSTYPYIELSASGSVDLLINEIVFVGRPYNSDRSEAERYVVPAEVYSATHYRNESAEDARLRAEALIDACPKEAPADYQTTFSRYSKDEIYSLMTLAEMRQGQTYAVGAGGEAADVYHGDTVFGAFGMDFLALGTAIFGMCPFGLRFFPMLAAFGVLVVLSRLSARLFRSEKAGLVFAVLYALSCLTLGLGHLGTPVMIGIFFLACALSLTHRFYAEGIGQARLVSVLPLLLAGLCCAAAICVHSLFLIPVLGVVLLFCAGMVRQQAAKRYKLEKIVEEGDAQPLPAAEEGEEPAEVPEAPERRAGKVVAEYRFKNTAAPILFFAGIVIGAFLFALIGMAPAYYVSLKLFGDVSGANVNVFTLAWHGFVNGFTGVNAFAAGDSWNIFHTVFTGTGGRYAVTGMMLNWIALAAAAAGLVYTVWQIVRVCRETDAKARRVELRKLLIPLIAVCFAVLTAGIGGNAFGFVALVWILLFLPAAGFFGGSHEGSMAKAVRIANIVGLVLLLAVFGLLAVFTFSVPLPASLMTAIFG